jgi:RNA polymerase sigma-70 factor (ECF subfamily)
MSSVQNERIGGDCDPDTMSDAHREWLRLTFQRLERPLVAYALRLLNGNVELARDCVQDTFLRLCHESQSHVEGHVDAWLFKSCRNRAMDFHRKEARMTFNSDSQVLSAVASHAVEPPELVSRRDEQMHLQRQIDLLPVREQEVLSLRLGQGLSYKQIADIMELSTSNVGVLIHQAVTRLRTSMNQIETAVRT